MLHKVIFLICILIFTFISIFFYRLIWKRFHGLEQTPTGFGVILSIFLFTTSVVFQFPNVYLISLTTILIATIIYWFDDIIEISPLFRTFLSFITGAIIGAVFLGLSLNHEIFLNIFFCLIFGLINVTLTNIVNFYDGADLNLSTFIILAFILVLAFLPGNSEWVLISLSGLAFIIPFAIINSRPQTLYLGDSGSFVFASLLTSLIIFFLKDINSINLKIIIPIALPAFDVFFVLILRIKEKQDLLSRNYLHLYQKLKHKYGGYFYLLPQIGNTLLCLMFANFLQLNSVGNILSVLISIILITPIFYYFTRRLV